MGFLQLDSGVPLNMNTAIVSVWFRIPSATANAARAIFDSAFFPIGTTSFPAVNMGIVPLLTWGLQPTAPAIWEWHLVDVDCGGSVGHVFLNQPAVSYSPIQSPSLIGVLFAGYRDPGVDGTLAFNIETDDLVDLVNVKSQDNVDCSTGTVFETDVSYAGIPNSGEGQQESIGGFSGNGPGPFVPDHWHHLLISWDLGPSNSSQNSGAFGAVLPPAECITGSSKMWMSMDDINRDSDWLPAFWPGFDSGGYPFDSNSVISNIVGSYAGAPGSEIPGLGTASVSFSPVPSLPFSIPGPAFSTDPFSGDFEPVMDVEMAELQVYCGITLDTSVVANRRLFVDRDGFPVPMSVAAAFLGTTPDIALSGTRNWQNGINTGSAGSFTRFGTINPFFPSPGLGV